MTIKSSFYKNAYVDWGTIDALDNPSFDFMLEYVFKSIRCVKISKFLKYTKSCEIR